VQPNKAALFLREAMAKKGQHIQDLIGLVNALYPAELAEEWDNVGLQVGDPKAVVSRVMVALDPTLAAVQSARELGAEALLTHHPLIFKPIKKLTPTDAVGQVLWRAVQEGVAIVSAHTNLDCAVVGLNSWLAETLGVHDNVPLMQSSGDYLKVVVFVPVEYADAVADALFSSGAGQVGAYDQCSFRAQGVGTFRPGEGTKPFIGEVGKAERVAEVRLETIVPKGKLSRVLEKMIKAHPYEEVAYDLVPLQNHVPGAGLGRIGRLTAEIPLDAFIDQVKTALGCDYLRVCGGNSKAVHKVALCGGSGASLLMAAHRQGADTLVTGDVKYHDARQAEELGMVLIDAGHFATEKLMINHTVETLRKAVQARKWNIEFDAYSGEQEPFRVY